MNIDHSKHICTQKRKLISLMDRLGLSSHIDTHTRITQKSATTIDLIFSDFSEVISSGTINANQSDHLPVYIVKKKVREKCDSNFVMGRSYRDLDEQLFVEDIGAIDPEDLFRDPNPNTVWSEMYGHFIRVANRHCPIRRLKVSVDKPSYITTELIELMRDRHLAFKRARRLGDDISWTLARELQN